MGEGVGIGVGKAVGVGTSVGVGDGGAGVSWMKIGSDDTEIGVAESVGEAATSAGFAAKTLATMSIAITVRPATMPPSTQSRRGGVAGRRFRPPWTTPL